MRIRNLIVFLFLSILSNSALAKPLVLATITDLGAILKEVGGSEIDLEVICKGSQDPHHIEAKPSFMLTASKADLLVAVGLGLEVGWLPSIIRGAGNASINPGQKGYLEVGPLVDPIEVPMGKVTRAEGDVHPEGNPHITLDPIRSGQIAQKLAQRLSEIDPKNQKLYTERAEKFNSRLNQKMKDLKKRIEASGVKKIITYHKTLNYFFNRFGIENSGMLEPKPGVPPTGPHILSIITLAKEQKVPLNMIENFFDDKAAQRIKTDVPGLRVVIVPVAVGGESGINTLDDLYEKLTSVIESK